MFRLRHLLKAADGKARNRPWRWTTKNKRPEDFLPIGAVQDEDIFVVGYPKSGNTWFQNLLVGAVYGVDAGYAPDSVVQELVPDVHCRKFYKRFRTPTFFKSHNLPRPEYRRVVYLLRDGRDVMVSYYHHLKALRGDSFQILHMLRDSEKLFPCRWHEHITAWEQNPFQADILTIKYESLVDDAVTQLERFCRFAEISRDGTYLEKVVTNACFERMRDKEVKMGWCNPAWPKDKFFVRRGKVGSHKDELPKPALDKFLTRAAPALSRFGYCQ